jgi:ribosomal-protein-alanine N-acetyltransferase
LKQRRAAINFEFRKINDEKAQEIVRWSVAPPYDFYDWVSDPDDLAELLDPRRRGDDYFSAFDEKGALVGFFQFEREGRVVEVGLGLRPDLTGKGLGRGFLLAGLDFARRSFSLDIFRLSVATFNERAIKVYEGVGFVPRRTYTHESNGGVYEFLEMERRA